MEDLHLSLFRVDTDSHGLRSYVLACMLVGQPVVSFGRSARKHGIHMV